MMALHSASVTAIGFSQTTCLPLVAASTACSAWYSFGVETQTTSTRFDWHSFSTESKLLIPGYFSSVAAHASGRRSATAVSVTLSAILPICGRTWVAAMPTPAIPSRNFSAIRPHLLAALLHDGDLLIQHPAQQGDAAVAGAEQLAAAIEHRPLRLPGHAILAEEAGEAVIAALVDIRRHVVDRYRL